ncbi:MAG: penicillin-insensitive murein endopeptidase [Gammaproteobacteria bacterium]
MKRSLYLGVVLVLLGWQSSALGQESTCYGTTKNGKLENGVKLPSEGPNYVSYSAMAALLGRTYVHSTVRDVVVEAYRLLEMEQPGKVFKYAETGYVEGGRFKPHKTHQNGLSIDFMVPVINPRGASVHLSTHMLNKYGYNIEFDAKGRYENYRIDYEALGAHMVALHKAARQKNIEIWRVIFDPQLQPYLMETKYGVYIKQNIQLSKKRAWVRHDEHYHVDFKMKCKPM